MRTTELLVTEHRLIERLLKHIHMELDRIAETGKTDPLFVEVAVDFIRAYADRTHHGRDEDVKTMCE
jgi:hemerythrin-like domain-containing protein